MSRRYELSLARNHRPLLQPRMIRADERHLCGRSPWYRTWGHATLSKVCHLIVVPACFTDSHMRLCPQCFMRGRQFLYVARARDVTFSPSEEQSFLIPLSLLYSFTSHDWLISIVRFSSPPMCRDIQGDSYRMCYSEQDHCKWQLA